ncbi:TPA: hypothetical protein QFN59_002249 [Enterococcus faecium]
MDPNKQDQGALEAQKIKLYYNEVGEEKLDQYIETLAHSLIKFIRNFEDSEYVSERLKNFLKIFLRIFTLTIESGHYGMTFTKQLALLKHSI